MLTVYFFIEQDSPVGFTGMERLKDKLLMVLEKLHKEKEEEKVIVDLWCHLGHAYITNVDEGEMYKRYFFFAYYSPNGQTFVPILINV